YDAAQLTMDRATSDYFEKVAAALPQGQAKLGANWILGEVAATLNREERELADCPVSPEQLAALIQRIIDGTISNKIARDVFAAMCAGKDTGNPYDIIKANRLSQISDTAAIYSMIDAVLATQHAVVDEYLAGHQKAFSTLVGQVMKAAEGKANPQQVNQLLIE